jgi:hypothetical protein
MHPNPWKEYSANFAQTEFSEVRRYEEQHDAAREKAGRLIPALDVAF